MSRKNHIRHPRKVPAANLYDLDYVSLPEYRNIARIIAKPIKTLFINLDARPDCDNQYVAHDLDDEIMQAIAMRI